MIFPNINFGKLVASASIAGIAKKASAQKASGGIGAKLKTSFTPKPKIEASASASIPQKSVGAKVPIQKASGGVGKKIATTVKAKPKATTPPPSTSPFVSSGPKTTISVTGPIDTVKTINLLKNKMASQPLSKEEQGFYDKYVPKTPSATLSTYDSSKAIPNLPGMEKPDVSPRMDGSFMFGSQKQTVAPTLKSGAKNGFDILADFADPTKIGMRFGLQASQSEQGQKAKKFVTDFFTPKEQPTSNPLVTQDDIRKELIEKKRGKGLWQDVWGAVTDTTKNINRNVPAGLVPGGQFLKRSDGKPLLSNEWTEAEQADDEFAKMTPVEKENLMNKLAGQNQKKMEVAQFMQRVDRTFVNSLREIVGDEKLKEMEQQGIMKEGLRKSIGEFGKSSISGRTFGVSDRIVQAFEKNFNLIGRENTGGYEPGLIYEDNKELMNATNTTIQSMSLAGSFYGGAKPYSQISGFIEKKLGEVPGKFGAWMSKHPITTSYTIQNLGEELVEAGIRKGTGQEYTKEDFLSGIGMGTIFNTVGKFSDIKAEIKKQNGVQKAWLENSGEVMHNIEDALATAEKAKGSKLTTPEVFDVVMPMKINDKYNMQNLFHEAREVHLKGMNKGTPGIDYAAPLVTKTNTEIPTELNPLIQEAKKYKNADEFIDNVLKKPGENSLSSIDNKVLEANPEYINWKEKRQEYKTRKEQLEEAFKKKLSENPNQSTDPFMKKDPEVQKMNKEYGKITSWLYQNDAHGIQTEVGKMIDFFDAGKTEKNLRDFYSQYIEKPNNINKLSTEEPKINNENFDVDAYVKEQINKREAARETPKGKIAQKAGEFYQDLKTNLIDYTLPITDAYYSAAKKYSYKELPEFNIDYAIDRTLRAPTLAGQFLEDHGLADVIKQVPDLQKLDQYLIARQAAQVEKGGFATGRDLGKDKMMMEALAPEYEPYAQKVTAYSQKLLDYGVESGLISKESAARLKEMYPDYVPINRVFNEMELSTPTGGTSTLASVSKQKVIKNLKGSEREIENPLESLMHNTTQIIAQGEKNKTARIMAGWEKLPGFEGKITELKKGESDPHTFSFLDNGVKRTFKTTPEIAAAAKKLKVEQLGLLNKVLNVPVRIFKTGTTGLEPSFILTNVVRDQLTAFINSQHGLKTSVMNPQNFMEALTATLKHDDLYKEVVRMGAGGSSFDISREQVKPTLERIRSEKDLGSKIKYMAKNKEELLRAVEDIVGRSEELTRIQQYNGTKQALMKEGYSEKRAAILAAQAAQQNTANFSRKGAWAPVLNTIPYLNAGIQGSRAFIRSAKRDPAGTAVKTIASLFIPAAVTTAWNLSDPKRAEAYKDIQDFEKEGYFIFVPDNPTVDPKTGKYNVIKVPMPSGVSSLTVPIRRFIEQASGGDPVQFKEFASSLINSVSPINPLDPDKTLSTMVPQIIKPALEVQTNKNLFTGGDIVPANMKDLSPKNQVKEDTSGLSRFVGKYTGLSPLQVDHLIRGYGGKLASEGQWVVDTVASKAGAFPENQIGGINPWEAVTERFNKASGGVQLGKAYDAKQEAVTQNADLNFDIKSKLNGFIQSGDKEGMLNYLQTLPKEKQTIVKNFFKDKAEEKKMDDSGATKLDKAVSNFSGAEAYQYYKDDLKTALQNGDKETFIKIVDSLKSTKAKKDLIKLATQGS